MNNEISIIEKSVTDFISAGTKAEVCYNFLKNNFQLRFNEITGNIEDWKSKKINGQHQLIGDRELNTLYIKLSCINKDVDFRYLDRFISSTITDSYNPFIDFIEKNKNVIRSPQLISDLAATIKTGSRNAEKYIKHWYCGMIASIFGSQSPFTLVLAGEKLNTGKTEWFRKLLPEDLMPYYAESKLDDGKDSDILMCKKLLIMDDEFGGKNKKNQALFKAMSSKQNISVRVPYGRRSQEMRRISVLGGTANELELLHDPYGNRRILPINVLDIDHSAYNKINKTALFMAVYDLYKLPFMWKFKQADIQQLNDDTGVFQATNHEAELIMLYFSIPTEENEGNLMTNTQMRSYIEFHSRQKLFDAPKFGITLKNLGYTQKRKSIKNIEYRMYHVEKNELPDNSPPAIQSEQNQAESKKTQVEEDLPF